VHLVYICTYFLHFPAYPAQEEKTTAFPAYPVQIKREYGCIPCISSTINRRCPHFLRIQHNKEKMAAFPAYLAYIYYIYLL
jgi:hypothetical protein